MIVVLTMTGNAHHVFSDVLEVIHSGPHRVTIKSKMDQADSIWNLVYSYTVYDESGRNKIGEFILDQDLDGDFMDAEWEEFTG
jgi:hypothetical protein